MVRSSMLRTDNLAEKMFFQSKNHAARVVKRPKLENTCLIETFLNFGPKYYSSI